MSCNVFANCMEVACKAGPGKVIAAFPDVCLSPPSPPAGPIPVPYPDTSFSKDMMNGSKTVKIKGQEVMLKDKSFFKTAPLGDEAATQGLGANVITHVITGKTYFTMWSMDVKYEGLNVDRNLDLTTSNHASMGPGEALPFPKASSMTPPPPPPPKQICPCCKGDAHTNQKTAEGKPAQTISEAEWYGPDAHKVVQEARANGCNNVPAEPDKDCGTYYKQTNANARQKARTRWESRYKKEYVARYNRRNAAAIASGQKTELKIEPDPKKEGEKIDHKTPISAGGCIKDDKNLERTADLSPKCQELGKQLDTIHTERVVHWDANP